jgi:hypothetical protein
LLPALDSEDGATEPLPPSDVDDDVHNIRRLAEQTGVLYSNDETYITTLSYTISVVFQLIEDRIKAFLKCKRRLSESCPEDLKDHLEANGILGVLQAALAQLGLDRFFAPTATKFLEHPLKKERADANYLEFLKTVSEVVNFGTPLVTENNQTLDVNAKPALYRYSFYKKTVRVVLRENTRMAMLDFLLERLRYPLRDKLTALLSSSLVGENVRNDQKQGTDLKQGGNDQEGNDILAVILLHIILDLQATTDGRAGRLLEEAQDIARSMPTAYNLHRKCKGIGGRGELHCLSRDESRRAYEASHLR